MCKGYSIITSMPALFVAILCTDYGSCVAIETSVSHIWTTGEKIWPLYKSCCELSTDQWFSNKTWAIAHSSWLVNEGIALSNC